MVLLSLAASACATAPAWPPIDLAILPQADQHGDAAAVRLEDRTEVRFAIEEGALAAYETNYLRTLVLKEAGRGHARGYRGYSKTFDRVVEAGSRITRPDGTSEVKVQADMVDVLAISDGTLYQDGRILAVDHEHVPVGSVIEHRFVVRREQSALFAFSASFGAALPVESASLIIEGPPGFEIEHAATQGWRRFAWDPEVTRLPSGGTRWSWSQTKIAPVEPVEHGPDHADRVRIVAARALRWREGEAEQRSFADLDAFGRWIHQIQGRAAEPTPEIRAEAAAILAGAPPDPRERARLLYEWVQSNIRYVSVQVGLGGWSAHAAPDVLVSKYGDCKDKATILRSLLAAEGIPSRMVILHAHDGLPRRQLLPAIGVVNNHAILAIDLPDGTVFVDPTTRMTPFGQLPPSDQGAELLVVSADRAEVLPAPVASPGSDRVETRGSLSVDAEGRARGRITVVARGVAAERLEQASLGNRATQRHAIEWLSGVRRRHIERTSFQKGGSAGDVHFGGTADVDVPESIAGQRGVQLLWLNRVVAMPTPDLPDEVRTASVVLSSARQRSWAIDFTLPPGARATLPPPIAIDDEIGQHTSRWTANGEAVSVEISYRLRDRVYPPSQYAALRAFFQAVDRAAATPVVIER